MKNRLEVQELNSKLSAKENDGEASKIADASDLLGGKHNNEKLHSSCWPASVLVWYISSLVICVINYSVGQSISEWLLNVVDYLFLAFPCTYMLPGAIFPETVETIQGSPNILLHYACGKDVDIVQCVEKRLTAAHSLRL